MNPNIYKKTAKEIEDFIVEEFREKIIIKITHREDKNTKDWKVIELD